ncbi:exopolysaccharide biosynthesis protein [Pseudomonas sp. Q2-TVG4-2]|uniref:exopolysaccharide biosynthesis protein n=1 Tax=Pseudomonas sp. Q2-TVG4-2 TaxID=1685699 RepID=UPI001C63169A|nr:exopolysaccharide biosynthesis protein [Pseudomonas sp. Q2-TVG4-2]
MNLEQVLAKIEETPADQGQVSLKAILKTLGGRSFGSFLLVSGLIILLPLVGDIPGVPTLVGVMVFLVALQLLLGREHFWLPKIIFKAQRR